MFSNSPIELKPIEGIKSTNSTNVGVSRKRIEMFDFDALEAINREPLGIYFIDAVVHPDGKCHTTLVRLHV
tara:strand:- start:239959 stop:240171 length:213 start_codon:yes stop_codon:yes gene_type:complete